MLKKINKFREKHEINTPKTPINSNKSLFCENRRKISQDKKDPMTVDKKNRVKITIKNVFKNSSIKRIKTKKESNKYSTFAKTSKQFQKSDKEKFICGSKIYSRNEKLEDSLFSKESLEISIPDENSEIRKDLLKRVL